ncbi:MAG: PEP-CTERM sorting domain-containing protein [Desertifilum sp. SIO1I2]|nr:PEP-CTERM sorting domain-containing protein [Desertifilum sp. SIO1I2]
MLKSAIAPLAGLSIGAAFLSLGILQPTATQAMTFQFEGIYNTFSDDPVQQIPFSGEVSLDGELLQTLLDRSLDGLVLISSEPVFDPSAVFKIDLGGVSFQETGLNIHAFVALNGPFALLKGGFTLTNTDFTLSLNQGCTQEAECKGILSKNDSASPIGGYDFPVWRVVENAQPVPEPTSLLGFGAIGTLLLMGQKSVRRTEK